MQRHSRAAGAMLASALVMLAMPGLATADPDKKAEKRTRMPQQVLETDAPKGRGNGRSAEERAAAEAAEEELFRKLEQATSESSEGLTPVVMSDGTVMVDLEGRFQSVLIAVPTADGGYAMACQDGHAAQQTARHAHDVITGRTAAPAAKSELEEM